MRALHVVVFLVIGSSALAAASSPARSHAFWTLANADAADASVVPSSATPALTAPENADPNASGAAPLPTSLDSALVPYTGPNGSPGDSIVTPSTDRVSTYLVRSGDTLSAIADTFGVSVNTIIWANDLKNAKDIHPGDTLIILPVSGIEHTVGKQDTLASLAKRYNGDAGEIASYNGLDPTAQLAVGSIVIIPGGEIAQQATSRTPKSSNKGSRGGMAASTEPYLGGSGGPTNGYWTNPVPGGLIWQGIHGWNAVDIAAPSGTPIHAAAAGIVTVARDNGGWNGGYGNYAVISHDNGTQTLYAHMTHAIVTDGQAVAAGQVIGYVGRTGLATGPHLHFEVRGAANPFRNCALYAPCSPQ